MKQIKLYFKKTRLTPTELAVKLQGFLMEKVPSAYAEFLHTQETNPYSLWVLNQAAVQLWVVNLLTDEACEMIQQVLMNLEVINLDSYSDLIVIEKMEVSHLSNQHLLELFSTECDQQTFSIHFLTPTSFKTAGEYAIFPTTRLLFQSLMQKYSRLFPDFNTFDEELLDYISEHSKITSYRLQTSYFTIHQKKIPAFLGRVTIKIKGASTLKAYIKMLLTFGEFSGVGIKTSMGMGGLEIEKRKT